MTEEPTTLERRYRRVLGMLPGWYREDREEEMVATFLAERDDKLDLEYSWPGWRETAAVAALAVRSRLAGDAGPARALAVGHAVRLVALLGLLAQATMSLAMPAAINLASTLHLLDTHGVNPGGLPPGGNRWLPTLLVLLNLPSVAAFVALVTGRRRAAKILAGVPLLVGLAQLARQPEGVTGLEVLSPGLILLGVPLMCLLVGFHRDVPAIRARPWLVAFAVAIATTTALSIGTLATAMPFPFSLYSVAIVAGAAVVVARFRSGGSAAAWLTAVTVCAGVVAAANLLIIPAALDVSAGPTFSQLLLGALWIGTIAVAVAGIVTGVLAARALGRLDGPPRWSPGQSRLANAAE